MATYIVFALIRRSGENIREFMGKPMIAYPITNALETGLFDEVMVSTDDAQIAETALLYGAKVPFLRTEETADDTATTASVIAEVLQKYISSGKTFEYVCCLYPCTPLLSPEHIRQGFVRVSSRNFNTVLTVQAFDFPIQRALETDGDEVRFLYPEYALTRSQDLDTLFHDAGQFYWLNVASFLSTGTILGNKCGYVVLSEMDGHDIDTETDWKMAELKYTLK